MVGLEAKYLRNHRCLTKGYPKDNYSRQLWDEMRAGVGRKERRRYERRTDGKA